MVRLGPYSTSIETFVRARACGIQSCATKSHGCSAMSACLYRCYSSDEQLLYIGISIRAATRLREHGAQSSWFGSVARIAVEHFASRGDAASAELLAIRTERPKFNIVGKVDSPPKRSKPVTPLGSKTGSYYQVVVDRARALVEKYCGVRKAAAAIGVNASLLSQLSSGKRGSANSRTLAKMGLAMVYERLPLIADEFLQAP